jgi:hypothetical protein
LRTHLALEQLEDRWLPSNYTAASVPDLIADINAANLNGGANAITLAANTPFTLTAVDNTTDGPTGLPVIAAKDQLTIIGNLDSLDRSPAAGTPAFRLFDVAAGAGLTLENLTLQGGIATFEFPAGGAIYNQGTLRIDDCILSSNVANSSGAGGAIFNGQAGSATIDASTLAGNSAGGGGGIFNAGNLAIIDHSTLSGNTGGEGGALANSGTARLDQSFVCGNAASINGGGITNDNGFGATLYVNQCLLSDNTAPVGGGIENGGTATIRQSTLSGNAAVLTLEGSFFSFYFGGVGGAIYNHGTMDVEQSVLSGNSASGNLALYPFDGGGAIWNSGTLTVVHCTLSGNSAANGDGGAVFNAGQLLLDHSSLSDNTAGIAGGGIYNDDGTVQSFGTLTVQQSTVSSNSAPLGADLYNAGSATLLNSLVCMIDGSGQLTIM